MSGAAVGAGPDSPIAPAPHASVPARIAIGALTVYQHTLSVLLGPRCRFYPSCSEYSKQCFQLYPFGKAVLKTAGRLGRCHPFHPGGIDLP